MAAGWEVAGWVAPAWLAPGWVGSSMVEGFSAIPRLSSSPDSSFMGREAVWSTLDSSIGLF